MTHLKSFDIKKDTQENIKSENIDFKQQAQKQSSTTNFKKRFEEGITPEALRESLHKKISDLWGK